MVSRDITFFVNDEGVIIVLIMSRLMLFCLQCRVGQEKRRIGMFANSVCCLFIALRFAIAGTSCMGAAECFQNVYRTRQLAPVRTVCHCDYLGFVMMMNADVITTCKSHA